MSQVPTLLSWMSTFGSSVMPNRSFAESPVTRPSLPQWYGIQIWCTTRPSIRSGVSRSVTSTFASIAARAVTTCAQPRWSSPRSPASSGDTSTNISGCSSDRYANCRLIPPAVWCSVSRLVVKTYGKTSACRSGGLGLLGLSARAYTLRVGLACCRYSGLRTGDSTGS